MKVKVNSAKLEAMGYEKVKAACMIHAMKAIQHQNGGDPTLVDMHCALLDRCAEVGRRLKNSIEISNRPTAAQLLGHALFQ